MVESSLDSTPPFLRSTTWGDFFVRWIDWKWAAQEDEKVIRYLISQLYDEKCLKNNPQLLEATTRFVKTHLKCHPLFKKLNDTLFARKCIKQLPSLKINDLIEEDGTSKGELLLFLKANFLHRIIPKANPLNQATAILPSDRHSDHHIYLRAKNGNDFLDTVEHIDLILNQISSVNTDPVRSAEHPDYAPLNELKKLLAEKQDDEEIGREIHQEVDREVHQKTDREIKIEELRHSLKSSNYCYVSLNELNRNNKGLLLSHAYLAEGVEEHTQTQWETLKPAFRENTNESENANKDKSNYKLRIVTRLPAYALKKTYWEMITSIVCNILNFQNHGHSWVELVEPHSDSVENRLKQNNIYNVGYYFHPLSHYRHFKSVDPISYLSIPDNQRNIEEIKITKEQFLQAKLYIEETQKLSKNSKRTLNDLPTDPALTSQQIKDICHLYKSTLKGTCLSFANTLKEVITGKRSDHRAPLRRWLFPKKDFQQADANDQVVEQFFLVSQIIDACRFLCRMELPFWVKVQRTQTPQQVEKEFENKTPDRKSGYPLTNSASRSSASRRLARTYSITPRRSSV